MHSRFNSISSGRASRFNYVIQFSSVIYFSIIELLQEEDSRDFETSEEDPFNDDRQAAKVI